MILDIQYIMKTINEKQKYINPQIERVNLDNEISLVLVSSDPEDPFVSVKSSVPEYLNNDPFKNSIV